MPLFNRPGRDNRSPFNRDLDSDGFPKMPGDWIWKVFPFIFVTVFVAIIAYWIFVGFIAVKAVKSLDGCTPALVTHNDGQGNQSYSVECKKQ